MTPERLFELFQGRTDDFALQQADGHYEPARRPLTVQELALHLEGRQTVGVYQCRPENSTLRWLCIDLDLEDREWLDRLWKAAEAVGVRSNAMLREHSGRKGFHLWVFFAEWVEAAKVKRLGEIIVMRSELPRTIPVEVQRPGLPARKEVIEVYPKQDDLSRVPKGYGNLVKLPFGLHRVSGRIAEPLDVNGPVRPLSAAELETLLLPSVNVLPLPTARSTPPVNNGSRRSLFPCAEPMMQAVWPEGSRNRGLFLIVKRFVSAGYSEEEILERMQPFNAQRFDPPLSENELRKTIHSGMNYTSMECLDPLVVPFCSVQCPIYAREHPATPSGGPNLRKILCEPPLFVLPLTIGPVMISAADLNNWDRVRVAAMEQCNDSAWLPRRRANDWDRELQPLFQHLEVEEAPPEVKEGGIVGLLLRQFLGRATDDPEQVARRNVWRDDENAVYVFRGDAFVRFVQAVERGISRNRIWTAVRELGGRREQRNFADAAEPVDVWQVPV